jgi:hypothetical protein
MQLPPLDKRQIYPNGLKTGNFSCVKASRFDDLKLPNIRNMDPFMIVKSREL